jgi:methyltransferase (TIGR00027 family)
MSSTLSAQQRASRTAYDCAAVRAAVHAWSGCRQSDYLAIDFVRGAAASLRARLGIALINIGLVRLTRLLVSRTSKGADVLLFARQAVPDDMIRRGLADNPETQVVLLGAGLDTSGLRIGAERREAEQRPGSFFEVDLPAMQAQKRQAVARLLKSRPRLNEDNVVYVPCSFGEHELGKALGSAGFDKHKPTIWIWSGVIHYLTEDAVHATLDELRKLSARGSQLFFDFILLEAYQNPRKFGFEKLKARFDSFGEVMSFGFRQGEEHVRTWLSGHGLTFVRSYTSADMVALYQKTTGQQASSKGTPWSNLCIASF